MLLAEKSKKANRKAKLIEAIRDLIMENNKQEHPRMIERVRAIVIAETKKKYFDGGGRQRPAALAGHKQQHHTSLTAAVLWREWLELICPESIQCMMQTISLRFEVTTRMMAIWSQPPAHSLIHRMTVHFMSSTTIASGTVLLSVSLVNGAKAQSDTMTESLFNWFVETYHFLFFYIFAVVVALLFSASLLTDKRPCHQL